MWQCCILQRNCAHCRKDISRFSQYIFEPFWRVARCMIMSGRNWFSVAFLSYWKDLVTRKCESVLLFCKRMILSAPGCFMLRIKE